MRLIYAQRSINRNVSFEFLNRQLVWEAFTVRLPSDPLRSSLTLSFPSRNSYCSSCHLSTYIDYDLRPLDF
jgi:hypothetical protein